MINLGPQNPSQPINEQAGADAIEHAVAPKCSNQSLPQMRNFHAPGPIHPIIGVNAPGPRAALPPSKAASAPCPVKRRLIQQQLILLLHAHQCKSKDIRNGVVSQCALPKCNKLKELLIHMTTCRGGGRGCTTLYCNTSKQIILHWKNCVDDFCPVCLPLKRAERAGRLFKGPLKPLRAR